MGVFNVFKIVQMVPNHATHHIFITHDDASFSKTLDMLPNTGKHKTSSSICFTDFAGGFLSLIKLSAMCSPKYPFWRYFLRFDATRSITSLNNILGYGFLYPSTYFPPFASRLKNQNVFSRQIYPVFSLDFEGTIYVDSSAFLASNSSNFL